MNDLIILLQFADIPPVLFDFLSLLLRKCCSAAALLQGRQASRLLLLLPISTRLLIFLFLWNAALADLFFMHGGGYGWQFVVFAFADVGEGGADFKVAVGDGDEPGAQKFEVQARDVFVFAGHGRSMEYVIFSICPMRKPVKNGLSISLEPC